VAFRWLAAGWRDLMTEPAPSLLYGLGVFVVSAVIIAGLFAFGWDYILFPAFAGFMVVGPVLPSAFTRRAGGLRPTSRSVSRA